MSGVIETGVTSIAKEAGKYTFTSAIRFIQKKFELLDLSEEDYINYCLTVLKVKTLASGDRSLNIDDIYVPLRLLRAGFSTSIEVLDTTTLDNENRAVLIKGLAGQGKSTLLKKLLSNNSKNFARLPIFYELKNYRGGSLEKAISNTLISYGLRLGEGAIEEILTNSSVKLYLDAFDEVAPSYRQELLTNITRLVNSAKCNIICTTRPDTEIESLYFFETYTVCELVEPQILNIIENTCEDNKKASELCGALRQSSLYKKSDSVLKSPILVVLYCVSYNLGEEVPETLSQFYSNIFDTVFFKHDNLKGSVCRARLWNDNRQIYREIFNFISFGSLKSVCTTLKRDILIDITKGALEYLDQDITHSDRVLDEVVSITNLIIEDGFNEYRFVHKSIQEFYSASFVSGLAHDKKVEFYSAACNKISFYSIFENTLFYLKELDYYDYCEYLFIPSVSNFLNIKAINIDDDYRVSDDVKKIITSSLYMVGELTFNKIKKKESFSFETSKLAIHASVNINFLGLKVIRFIAEFLVHKLDINKLERVAIRDYSDNGQTTFEFTLDELVNLDSLSESEVDDAILMGVSVIVRKEYNQAINKIMNREKNLNSSSYLDF